MIRMSSIFLSWCKLSHQSVSLFLKMRWNHGVNCAVWTSCCIWLKTKMKTINIKEKKQKRKRKNKQWKFLFIFVFYMYTNNKSHNNHVSTHTVGRMRIRVIFDFFYCVMFEWTPFWYFTYLVFIHSPININIAAYLSKFFRFM